MILAAAMRDRTPIIVASVVFLVLLGISIKLLIPPPGDETPPTSPVDDANQMCSSCDAVLTGDTATCTAAATTTTAAATTMTVAATTTASAVTQTAAPGATTATAAASPAATRTVAPVKEAVEEAAAPPAPAGPADTHNAATHYLAAFKLMKTGQRKVMARVELAAAEGYQGGDEGVEAMVALNEPALSELAQAASCDTCDFGKATKPEWEQRREQAETLATLAAARCRMLAAQGQHGEALRLGVAVVKLAKDIRTPAELDAVETSQAVVETVFPSLASVLQGGKLSGPQLEPAVGRLRAARTGLAAPADAATADIASLRAQVLTFIQNDAYFAGKDWLAPLPSRMKAAMLTVAKAERRSFASDVMLEFDRRCMRLLDVLGSGKLSRVKEWTADMAQVMVDSKTPGFGRKPAEVAGYLTARFLPQVEPLWSNDAHDRLKGNALLAMAAAQLHRKQAGAWPESLAALAPSLLAEPPADPFDAEGGPLRYKVIGVQAVLWSVGPDGVDDGAASATGAGVAGKDIVFWLH